LKEIQTHAQLELIPGLRDRCVFKFSGDLGSVY